MPARQKFPSIVDTVFAAALAIILFGTAATVFALRYDQQADTLVGALVELKDVQRQLIDSQKEIIKILEQRAKETGL